MAKGRNLGKVDEAEILVGIVTLNRLEKLLRTLKECRSLGFYQFVVVDNGSTDGTRDFLRGQTDILFIFPEQNEGGSGGFGRIMRHFFEQTTFDYLLLMDDDAYPNFGRDRLARTLADHSPQSYMAYACKVTYPDGTLCEMNRPGKNVLLYHPLLHGTKDFHLNDDSRETVVDFAGFVGLVLTREAIRSFGVVSKHFFIYSDDTYYTLSISRKGGKILYCPQLVFTHDCKRSSRNFTHHDQIRIERDVVNKIVMIREYSSFAKLYIFLYLIRLLWKNPQISVDILRAAHKGISANLSLFRNQPI
jgi:GT2 family glycosyltransferase